jgi:predicted RNA binding protein YcfA (HicA-like mRNA interferase family)
LIDSAHITIDDCDQLLRHFGYTLNKGSGSHRVYHKKNARAVTIAAPHGTKYIKSIYVKLIVKILGLEDSN